MVLSGSDSAQAAISGLEYPNICSSDNSVKVLVMDQICLLLKMFVLIVLFYLWQSDNMYERGGQNLPLLTIVDSDKDSYGAASISGNIRIVYCLSLSLSLSLPLSLTHFNWM